mgnify:CR=1 FL=1
MSWEKVIKRGGSRTLDHDFLKEVAIQLESGKEFGTIKDVNGNKVGNWSK